MNNPSCTGLLDNSKKIDVPMKESEEAVKSEEMDTDNKDDEDKTELNEIDRESPEKETEVVNKCSDEDYMKVIRYLIAAGCDVNLPVSFLNNLIILDTFYIKITNTEQVRNIYIFLNVIN